MAFWTSGLLPGVVLLRHLPQQRETDSHNSWGKCWLHAIFPLSLPHETVILAECLSFPRSGGEAFTWTFFWYPKCLENWESSRKRLISVLVRLTITVIKCHHQLGWVEGLFGIHILNDSLSSKAVREGTQTGQQPGDRSGCGDPEECCLLTCSLLLLRLAFLELPGPPTLTWALPYQSITN